MQRELAENDTQLSSDDWDKVVDLAKEYLTGRQLVGLAKQVAQTVAFESHNAGAPVRSITFEDFKAVVLDPPSCPQLAAIGAAVAHPAALEAAWAATRPWSPWPISHCCHLWNDQRS